MRSPALLVVSILASILPHLTEAQAPRVTPAGDPSVRNDTIYSLAVDSTQHRGEPFVYLLDDGIIRLERDGQSRKTYRQVVQVLTTESARDWAEQSFSYSPERERFTINWLRVVRPDGKVVSAKPAVLQESDLPAETDEPVYVKRRVVRASVGGLAPGLLLDWSTTVESKAPDLRGDFFSTWRTITGAFTRRSRLLLDVPAGFRPTFVEMNLPQPREEQTTGGRTVYRWLAQEIPRPPARQLFAADSNRWTSRIYMAAPMTWDAVAAWYWRLASDRIQMTPPLEAKLGSLVAGAQSLADSLRAIHQWLAQDIRYVAVELGLGGYQPRHPAEVLQTGFGDCKDKATVMLTLLQRMGVKAYPVLLTATAHHQPKAPPPTLEAFNHVIVGIEQPSGYQYVDPTAAFTPFGELPFEDQGQYALVVHPDGKGEMVTLPMAPAAANQLVSVVRGQVNDSGFVHARVEIRASGLPQAPLRVATAERLDSAGQAAVARRLGSFFPFGKSDSLEAFDGKDLQAQPRISFVIDGGKLVTLSGTTSAVLPVQGAGAEAMRVLGELAAGGPRQYPIDIGSVNPPLHIERELELELPVGWQAALPANVEATGPFGRYQVEYRQAGRVLTIRRMVEGAMGRLPPEEESELESWFRSLAKDDASAIVISRPASNATR